MALLVTFTLLACVGFIPSDAVPLASRVRQEARDTFIIMPGVDLRRIFLEETPERAYPPTASPVLFGDSFTFDTNIPISFGDGGNKALPVQKEDKIELIPVSPQKGSEITSPSEGSGPPNVVNFPTERPVVGDPVSSTVAVMEDDGSGDNVFFPTIIKVNVKSDVDFTDSSDSVPGGNPCGPEFGSVDVNGTCHRFLARNACPEGEWYVINNENNEGECVPRPCPFGELMYRGTCVSATDDGVCSEGQMLYVDFTGYVHCDCLPNFIYDPWSGKCYAQGDQGHCNFGEYLYVDDEGLVQCKANPCLMNGFVFHNESGKCYRKLYWGFCEEGLLLVHANNLTAECRAVGLFGHSIFDLPTMRSCAGGSLRDYAGNCRSQFRVPSVSSYPTIYGGCPGAFIKDSAGTCRRTHKLFG